MNAEDEKRLNRYRMFAEMSESNNILWLCSKLEEAKAVLTKTIKESIEAEAELARFQKIVFGGEVRERVVERLCPVCFPGSFECSGCTEVRHYLKGFQQAIEEATRKKALAELKEVI